MLRGFKRASNMITGAVVRFDTADYIHAKIFKDRLAVAVIAHIRPLLGDAWPIRAASGGALDAVDFIHAANP